MSHPCEFLLIILCAQSVAHARLMIELKRLTPLPDDETAAAETIKWIEGLDR